MICVWVWMHFKAAQTFFPADSIKTVYHRTANRIAAPDPRKHSTQCVRPPGARILLMEIFYQNMCKYWLPLIYIHFVSGMCSVNVWNLRVAGQHSGGRLVFQTGSLSAAFHQRGRSEVTQLPGTWWEAGRQSRCVTVTPHAAVLLTTGQELWGTTTRNSVMLFVMMQKWLTVPELLEDACTGRSWRLADGVLSEELKAGGEVLFFCRNYVDITVQGRRIHHSDDVTVFLILPCCPSATCSFLSPPVVNRRN